MITITINGEKKQVLRGLTILQALYEQNIEIPRFCYHESLQIAGNCRMCLVEVEKSLKPIASCATIAQDGMNIKTETDLVKKAREGVMELLLVNHPLDCPICDQGGECDLQDQAMLFGNDRGRNLDYKRSVEDKNLGPLIKTVMTRCIHCTRCVRYMSDVTGVQSLGTTSRGNQMEIGTFLEASIVHELSGNVIDLCPVGALTSKPYAFTSRSWELQSTESVDVFDGVGSNIRIDTRGTEIMRIQPRIKKGLNNEWISDKIRFSYDGLKTQRLTKPLKKVQTSTGSHYETISWKEAFATLKKEFEKAQSFHFLCGPFVDAETMVAAKLLSASMENSSISTTSEAQQVVSSDYDKKTDYLLPVSFDQLKKYKNIIFVGINPRHDSSVVNVFLRQLAMQQQTNIFVVGPYLDLTYKYNHIGNSIDTVLRILEGRHPLAQVLLNTESLFLLRAEHGSFIKPLLEAAQYNYGFYHTASNVPTGFELGIPSGVSSSSTDVFQYSIGEEHFLPDTSGFKVYQGHHGDVGATAADLILPSCSFVEKSGTYLNIEGRAQEAKRALDVKGLLFQDWEILRAFSYTVGIPLAPRNLFELRQCLTLHSPRF